MKYECGVGGMGCMHCVKKVRGALEALGANNIEVEIGHAVLEFDGAADEIVRAIEAAGFESVYCEAR